MVNIRRKVLTIICVLSISMLVSSCDTRGVHTENKQGDLSVSDVNDVLVNEEEKTVEPRDMTLLNTRITKPGDSMFEAKLDNGKYIRMSFRCYDNAAINIGIKVNGATIDVVRLNADNKGDVVTYTIKKTSTFKFVYEITNANSTVLDVIVKQYEYLP